MQKGIHGKAVVRYMKRVVVLNGSPRPQGKVSTMLRTVMEALPEKALTEYVAVPELSFRPCTGCMRCRTLHRCVLPEDDAHRVADLLRQADALLIGSPCYWGNMSGSLKSLFDRTVYAMMDEGPNGLPKPLHKGKKAVLVASCNTAYPFSVWFSQISGTFRALREFLRWSGYRVVGTVGHSGARWREALSPREIEKCKKMANKIC